MVGLLDSKDNVSVLAALTFLGGWHLAEPRRKFAPEPQASKYSDLFHQLISNAEVRERIKRLADSENEWVKQAAVSATRGPRERLWQ